MPEEIKEIYACLKCKKLYNGAGKCPVCGAELQKPVVASFGDFKSLIDGVNKVAVPLSLMIMGTYLFMKGGK
jgi:hypothetical protein